MFIGRTNHNWWRTQQTIHTEMTAIVKQLKTRLIGTDNYLSSDFLVKKYKVSNFQLEK